MWKNLKDMRGTMERIGHVVAPPVDDDEDVSIEDVSIEDDDDAYYDDEDEYEEEYEQEEETRKGAFGLVGILKHALDAEQSEYDGSHPDEQQQHDDRGDGEDEEVIDLDYSAVNTQAEIPEHNSMLETPSSSMISNKQHDEPLSQSYPATATRENLVSPTSEEARMDTFTVKEDRIQKEMVSPLEEPKRFALVRESGTVSPFKSAGSNKKGAAVSPASLANMAGPSVFQQEDADSMDVSGRSTQSKESEERFRADAADTQPPKSPRRPSMQHQQQQADGTRESSQTSTIDEKADADRPSTKADMRRKVAAADTLLGGPPLTETMVPPEQSKSPEPALLNDRAASSPAPDAAASPDGGQSNMSTAKAVSPVASVASPSAPSDEPPPSQLPMAPIAAEKEEKQQPMSVAAATAKEETAEVMDKAQEPSDRVAEMEQQIPPRQDSDQESPEASQKSQAQRHSRPSRSEERQHAMNGLQSPTTAQDEDAKRIEGLERRCRDLQQQLHQSESHIVELQQQAVHRMEKEDQDQERMMVLFQEKEARLLEAAAEDHQQEMNMLRTEMDTKLTAMQQEVNHEREVFQRERDQMQRLLQESSARVEAAERDRRQALNRQDKEVVQHQQRQERALHMAEDKLAQTLAMLDDRDAEVIKLRDMVKTLQSRMSQHHEGAKEAEEELDELHAENESLHHHVETVEEQCTQLRARVRELEAESEKSSHLKMELRMLKEDRERERAKVQSAAASAESNTVQLVTDRDAALAEVQDLKQQLAAVFADVEVARSDTSRVMTGNNNLQAALEAFQNEREAELAMIEEQRLATEEAAAAAHAAALEATHEAHEAHIREIQAAADTKYNSAMEQVRHLEEKLEKYRVENFQMRRSLDEAIQRLQTNQEDVIDRTLMKNILLDWLTKTGRKERQQVLELMASVLHFTEEEKEKVHINEGTGALGKVVGTVAAPLPAAKADMEHLEGDNVREKWVNFLLGETDD